MKNKKPVLLIDQDDVMAEYISSVVETFNQKYDTCFKDSDCIRWDLVSIFGEEIMEVMHDPKLFRALRPVPNAIETFKRLYESELFDMYIVTAAHPSSVEAKFEWIKEYMPFFPTNHVMVCSVKHMVKGDFLLDDGMHNIEAFEKAGGKSIIFDRAHNNQEPTPGYERVHGWLEYEEYIVSTCYPELAADYFKKKEIEQEAI